MARERSARRRVISACSGLTVRRPAAAVNSPASYCFSQRWMSLGRTSNFSPQAIKLRFSAFLCRTTSALKSSVKVRRFNCSFLMPSKTLCLLPCFILLLSLRTQRKAYRIRKLETIYTVELKVAQSTIHPLIASRNMMVAIYKGVYIVLRFPTIFVCTFRFNRKKTFPINRLFCFGC